MSKTINTKELRATMPEVVRRVQKGERFTVLYRSRPAFRIVPIDAGELPLDLPLEEDPLYGAEAIGGSTDGLTSVDHDRVLYDGPK